MSRTDRHTFLPSWPGLGHYLCMTTTAPIHGDISENVRSALAKRGLSQTDLAEWLGIQPNSASRLITGRRPWSLDYLQVIADKLGVSVSLLTGSTSALMQEIEKVRQTQGAQSQNRKSPRFRPPFPAAMCAA